MRLWAINKLSTEIHNTTLTEYAYAAPFHQKWQSQFFYAVCYCLEYPHFWHQVNMSIYVTGKSFFIIFIISSVRHNSRWGILPFQGISTQYADSSYAFVHSKKVSNSPRTKYFIIKNLTEGFGIDGFLLYDSDCYKMEGPLVVWHCVITYKWWTCSFFFP